MTFIPALHELSQAKPTRWDLDAHVERNNNNNNNKKNNNNFSITWQLGSLASQDPGQGCQKDLKKQENDEK